MPTVIRRATVALLTLALLLPATALGKSLFRTGKYRGADDARYLRIAFTAGKARHAISPSRSSACRGSAAPGNAQRLAGALRAARPAIGRKGVFKLSAESKAEYVPSKVMIRGTLKGSTASGSFRLTLGPWTTAPPATRARWPGRPSAGPSRPPATAPRAGPRRAGQLQEDAQVRGLAVRPAPADHRVAGEHPIAVSQAAAPPGRSAARRRARGSPRAGPRRAP